MHFCAAVIALLLSIELLHSAQVPKALSPIITGHAGSTQPRMGGSGQRG
jgi:hypothetical protein